VEVELSSLRCCDDGQSAAAEGLEIIRGAVDPVERPVAGYVASDDSVVERVCSGIEEVQIALWGRTHSRDAARSFVVVLPVSIPLVRVGVDLNSRGRCVGWEAQGLEHDRALGQLHFLNGEVLRRSQVEAQIPAAV